MTGSNKGLVDLTFSYNTAGYPWKKNWKKNNDQQAFNKNLVIMTHHQLLMACGDGFVWINPNVALAGQQWLSASEKLCDLLWLAVVLFEQQQVACVLGFLLLVNLSLFGTSADSQETRVIGLSFPCLDLVATWQRCLEAHIISGCTTRYLSLFYKYAVEKFS